MKKSRFADEQTLGAIRQVAAGTPPADTCRQLRYGAASFDFWKKRYGNF